MTIQSCVVLADVDSYNPMGNVSAFGNGGLFVTVVGPDGCHADIHINTDTSVAIQPVLVDGNPVSGFTLNDSSTGSLFGTAVC